MLHVPYLDLDRVRLFFTDHGAGQAPVPAPALLLVHGWGGDGGQFAALAARFSDRRLIIPDLRGHGASRAQWDDADWRSGAVREADFAPRALAGDLARLLAAVGTGPVVAVGHSMGGQVVTALAVEHPDLVRGLVVLDPAYGADDAEIARMPAEQEALRSEGSAWAARFVASAFSPRADPGMIAREQRLMASTDPRVLIAARDGMYLAPDAFGAIEATREYLARCKTPTLALYSNPRPARRHRAGDLRHPGTMVAVVPGVGHYVHLEDPDAVAEAIRPWLSAVQ